jgi:hypothetical protein
MTANRQNEPHLSSTQLAAWVTGDREALAMDHVASCPVCRNKVEQFESALRDFRSSVREWGEGEFLHQRPAVPPASRAHRSWRSLTAIAAVCLTAVFVVALFVRRETPISPEPSAHNDAALLSQIDQEVSRTVPAAMDPLSALVAGDDAQASGSVAR